MPVTRSILGLVAICAIVVLLAFVGLAGDFLTGLEFNIDGLLLLSICLVMGGIFAIMLFLIAKQTGWLARLPVPRRKHVAQAPAPAGSPANPPSREGK